MSGVEPITSPTPGELRIAGIARASALAPLLVIGPLAVFVLVFSAVEPLPQMPASFGPMLLAVGVLPVDVVLVAAYFVVAIILRAIGLLRLRWLLVVSALASVAIGYQFLLWAADGSAMEQVESFAFGAGVYLLISFSMSWLWRRLVKGSSSNSAPAVPSAGEA